MQGKASRNLKRSGTEGKYVEARDDYRPARNSIQDMSRREVLEDFTEEFRRRYGVECVSALHHNKRKTNYHIHLILPAKENCFLEPDIKIATRSVFYDETGKKGMRTKKEIIGEDGQIRKGCTVIKKGEVYEKSNFTAEDDKFKK